MEIFLEIADNEGVEERHVPVSRSLDQYCAITEKRCGIECKLVLFTLRKWHTYFRLVSKSVTLNDLVGCDDRRRSLFLR